MFRIRHLATLALALTLGTAPAALAADGTIADVFIDSSGVAFRLLIPDDGTTLTVNGPRCARFEKSFSKGQTPVYEVPRDVLDGLYTYRLYVQPPIDSTTRSILKDARANDNSCVVWDLRDDGRLPNGPQIVDGYFTVDKGRIILQNETEDLRGRVSDIEADRAQIDLLAGNSRTSPLANTANGATFENVTALDQVINDDLIVLRSLCVGFDCVNGESFGADTIRLKENNLRIHFQDTSVGAFPTNDWRITANSNLSGGANKFSIDDVDGARTPFTIEARAPSNSLYVDDAGRVGFGTSTPVVDNHVVSGNTPTLRLEQNGSSGFAPQTWDVAGNETSFFIRDATNGSTLPFRIFPGAASSSLVIAGDNDIGMGTSSPAAALHVRRTNGTAGMIIEEASGTEDVRDMLQLINNGRPRWRMEDTSANGQILTVRLAEGDLDFSFSANPGDEVEMKDNGDMTIAGTLTENSDRDKKHNIVPVTQQDILAKVMQLPLATWQRINDDPDVIHLGPMAQDFHALFGLGVDNRHIATIDTSGVALAAIQALGAKLEAKQSELEALKAQNDDLLTRLLALEARISP